MTSGNDPIVRLNPKLDPRHIAPVFKAHGRIHITRIFPDEVAERISAMVDGLCFRSVVGYSWTPLERVRTMLRAFACEQLGIAPADLPEMRLSRQGESARAGMTNEEETR